MIYKKRQVEVEAFQFYVDKMPDWFMDKVSNNEIKLMNCDYKRYEIDKAYCEIDTLEGVMRANGGDFIIKGVNGEIYPCKADIFNKTYEKLGEKSPRIEASECFQELREKMLEARKNTDVDMDKFYDTQMRGFAKCMEVLDYGTRFIFIKDYITETREYKKGTKCNTLNNVVVLSRDGKYLFDMDSGLAREFGEIINLENKGDREMKIELKDTVEMMNSEDFKVKI